MHVFTNKLIGPSCPKWQESLSTMDSMFWSPTPSLLLFSPQKYGRGVVEKSNLNPVKPQNQNTCHAGWDFWAGHTRRCWLEPPGRDVPNPLRRKGHSPDPPANCWYLSHGVHISGKLSLACPDHNRQFYNNSIQLI